MVAWGDWIQANSKAIVDVGASLGKTLKADSTGVTPHESRITGYIIVEADSHQAAAELFKSHPHFSKMPGDSVEIMECLSLT